MPSISTFFRVRFFFALQTGKNRNHENLPRTSPVGLLSTNLPWIQGEILWEPGPKGIRQPRTQQRGVQGRHKLRFQGVQVNSKGGWSLAKRFRYWWSNMVKHGQTWSNLWHARNWWLESTEMATEGGLKVPSGKRLHSYRKSPCLIGKSTISTGPFSIAMLNYQMVYDWYWWPKLVLPASLSNPRPWLIPGDATPGFPAMLPISPANVVKTCHRVAYVAYGKWMRTYHLQLQMSYFCGFP